MADKEGNMSKENKLMLESIIRLERKRSSEVMVHRKDMFSINKEISKQALLNQLNEVNFTRLPIWDKNPENIVGIILVKDLLKMIIKSKKLKLKR